LQRAQIEEIRHGEEGEEEMRRKDNLIIIRP
jgi:hypothetical protein